MEGNGGSDHLNCPHPGGKCSPEVVAGTGQEQGLRHQTIELSFQLCCFWLSDLGKSRCASGLQSYHLQNGSEGTCLRGSLLRVNETLHLYVPRTGPATQWVSETGGPCLLSQG